jgi:hypothetical protein
MSLMFQSATRSKTVGSDSPSSAVRRIDSATNEHALNSPDAEV